MVKKQTTPPKKELPWEDDPRLGHYIDDNALFVLDAISKGRFEGKSASYFLFVASCQPLEWDHKTLVKFLVRIAEEYGIELKNFETMTYAFAEEYEESVLDEKTGKPLPGYERVWEEYSKGERAYGKKASKYKDIGDEIFSKELFGKFPTPPKKYGGAYQWALDEIKEKPQSPEGILLSRIFDNKLDLADLKEAIKISDRILPVHEPEDSERFLEKRIFNDIVQWASFETVPDKQITGKLRQDLDDYLERFINDSLKIGSRRRRMGEVSVLQSPNIYRFNKHKQLFFEQFRDMQESYGDTFIFENPFEKILPDNEEDVRQRYAERKLLFMHTILALAKLGYIKILTLGNNWDFSEETVELRDLAKIVLLSPALKELGVQTEQGPLYFDEDKSRLFIRGKEIRVRKFSDQYHALRIIFNSPKETGQEWFFSEIAEKVDEANINDKKYYNAIYQVGQKMNGAGFPDFFITTRQSVKINPDYLS